MGKELTPDERLLLEVIRKGVVVTFRAVSGRAEYYSPAIGSKDCTLELVGLVKKKLVEIDTFDKRVGWVTYKIK